MNLRTTLQSALILCAASSAIAAAPAKKPSAPPAPKDAAALVESQLDVVALWQDAQAVLLRAPCPKFQSCEEGGEEQAALAHAKANADLVATYYAIVFGLADARKSGLVPEGQSPFTWAQKHKLDLLDIVKVLADEPGLKGVNAKPFVDALLTSYDRITAKKDWEAQFKKIRALYPKVAKMQYDETEKVGFDVDIPMYEKFGFENLTDIERAEGLPFDAYLTLPSGRNYMRLGASLKNYFPSFWYRRWADGTLKPVHAALVALRAIL